MYRERNIVMSNNEKNIKKIINGAARKKSKTKSEKIRHSFIPEDLNLIGDYIIRDILIPSVKSIIFESFKTILFGEDKDEVTGSRSSTFSRVAYDKKYGDSIYKRYKPSGSTLFDYDDIVFESKMDAELVLDELYDVLERYNVVTLNDFYDMAGESNDNYQYSKYGWTDLKGSKIVSVREGYVIKLPKPIRI